MGGEEERRRGGATVFLVPSRNQRGFYKMNVEERALLADTLRWRCFISYWLHTVDLWTLRLSNARKRQTAPTKEGYRT